MLGGSPSRFEGDDRLKVVPLCYWGTLDFPTSLRVCLGNPQTKSGGACATGALEGWATGLRTSALPATRHGADPSKTSGALLPMITGRSWPLGQPGCGAEHVLVTTCPSKAPFLVSLFSFHTRGSTAPAVAEPLCRRQAGGVSVPHRWAKVQQELRHAAKTGSKS